jgi:hypothetical protein
MYTAACISVHTWRVCLRITDTFPVVRLKYVKLNYKIQRQKRQVYLIFFCGCVLYCVRTCTRLLMYTLGPVSGGRR